MMKPDVERMRSLLAESIMAMCRDGLQYREKFSVEGLIGITLDDRDVFLVSIHDEATGLPRYQENYPDRVSALRAGSQILTNDHKNRQNALSSSCRDSPVFHSSSPVSDTFANPRTEMTALTPVTMDLVKARALPCTSSERIMHRPVSMTTVLASVPINKSDIQLGHYANENVDGLVIDDGSHTQGLKPEYCTLDMGVEVPPSANVYDCGSSRLGDNPSVLGSVAIKQETDNMSCDSFYPDQAQGMTHIEREYAGMRKYLRDHAGKAFLDTRDTGSGSLSEHGRMQADYSLFSHGMGIFGQGQKRFPSKQAVTEGVDLEEETESSGSEYIIPESSGSGAKSANQETPSIEHSKEETATEPVQMVDIPAVHGKQSRLKKHKTSPSKLAKKSSLTTNGESGIAVKERSLAPCMTQPAACSECGKVFKHKYLLKSHLDVHTNIKPYMCDVCGASFKRKGDLVRHKQRHLQPKNPRITSSVESSPVHVCGIVETQSDINSGHTQCKDELYSCDLCEKTYVYCYALEQHKLSHARDRPYICEICGKSFLSPKYLKGHVKTHDTRRVFECDICNVKCKSERILAKHKLRHDESRLFTCNKCGKQFSFQYLLKAHDKNVHLSNAEYKCTKCGKSFKWLNSLHRHKLFHLGKYNCLCSICGKPFQWPHNLKSHMRQQHAGME